MQHNRPALVLLVSFYLMLSCKSGNKDNSLFRLMSNTGINFTNQVEATKEMNVFNYRNFFNGAGVAIGDINNDGLPDVFFTSNQGANKLYLNKGNFQFEDVSVKAGIEEKGKWNTGVVMADVNGDGWLDIYVCQAGFGKFKSNEGNKLFINNHDGTFTEKSKEYGLDVKGYTTQVSFFDYDMDGDLDCFIINNSPIPVNTLNYANSREILAENSQVADFLKGGGDHLYRNDNGKFTEVTKQAGIHGSLISFGLGVNVADINGDGYPDIYVSNDFFERDYLYINQRDGTYKDQLEDWIQHTSLASMGADIADINNDGYPDIFTTDMLPDDDYRLKTTSSFDDIDVYKLKEKSGFYHQYMQNCLQLNNKNKKFFEIANYSGVPASDWSWGALMFDADNDGFADTYVCNGIYRDLTNQDFIDYFANDIIQKMVLSGEKEKVQDIINKMSSHPLLNKAFRNKGNLQFEDMGKAWGFDQPSFSNGAAYGDLDNDGDLDLVVNNENGPAFIYKNNARELNKNNYVGVFLKGKGKNTFAIGSKVKIYKDEQVFYREVVPSRGFQSSVDYKQIIGLGKITQVDSMIITWPDRTFIKFDHPAIDTVYVIQQKDEKNTIPGQVAADSSAMLLHLVQSSFEKHREDDNIDFYYERNLPKMLSREGPKAAVGDVNGDGLADVYIGGTPGHYGQLYLQTPSGRFIKKEEPAFQKFIDFDDEAVLFFDADHDGDLDLFIGPGGNNHPASSTEMQNRLFLNDGKGNFTLAINAFPNNTSGINTGIAVAYDFNHDGYTDLFVGGRSVSRQYGSSPSSYLFVNDGSGHFTDIAKTKNPEIANIGMVTGAVWADVSGDKEKELIITGEWMAPRIFSFHKDHFEEIKTNLGDLFGWWQTVAVADVNGDGKMDLILGNIGDNFYLHPDSLNPVKLWVNDFDQNGTTDNILTRTIGGKDMPVFLKHDMEAQIPSLKKQNLKHESFAKKSIQELFSPALINAAVVKKFVYTSSVIAINEGNGKFNIQKLPREVEFSSVNAILCRDVNKDGYMDLILGGNEFGFLPQLGRLDASFGHVLLNDGKGQFKWIGSDYSGLELTGQIRDISEIAGKDKDFLLFLRNDEYPALYELNKQAKK